MMFRVLLGFLISFAMATSLQAQSVEPDAESIAEALHNNGYKAIIKSGEDNEKYVESATAGYRFIIFLYGCTENKNCDSIQFYAGFSLDDIHLDLEKINAWNAKRRYGRAYRDNVGDAVVEMDIGMTSKGINASILSDSLELWDTIVAEYSAFVFDADANVLE